MLKISTNFNWGVTKKSVVSTFSSFGKEEWSKTEVVGKMMCIPNFIVNEIGVHSPTPPPTGTPPSRRELRYYRLLVTSIVDTTAFSVNLNEDSFDF